ncbi:MULTISPECIES: nitrogen regulation protein NR(II) [unclassified Lentimonas]|uniref:two-component system sensor histidine kinase NtrB n=1 Tax=unclassified Lentimonas TaxID=2630993 RepID=UPI00132190A1|nr:MULTISPECIES: ATP-binding protein [unclassified Lentimonas]CAA6677294.1 Two-component sensor PilS [Lentimonas sp. CC4]CAA6686839.1 Two-component sensor PilS [Lentimonas sp. CC6]CAA7074540.1 Two-component sensor PilS [Lentimonas sp. CC4]CAA7169156.1 Two-component sensor PilS [Lentimonas sp. CC21]CAA7180443.1 Two-component sensor PilS [Lentimonas sp. CC8]
MKNSGLDKILGRIDDLDSVNLGILVQRLARDRKLQETVFNTIQDGILVIDSEGVVQYANEAAFSLIGLKEDDIGTTRLWKMVPDLARSIDLDKNKKVAKASPVLSREVELTYPEHRFVRLYMVPIDANVGHHDSGGTVVVLSDVTEEKVSMEERIESERIASIMRLSAGVAHELGNPLNSLTIHLQLIERKLKKLQLGAEASGMADSLEVCQGEVKRLDGIITHFLEAVRPQQPELNELDLIELLDEVLRVQEAELSNRRLDVNVDVAQTIPSILGDRGQIKQVFFNLVKNAMEAMQAGGKLRVLARSDDEFVYLQFIDTGSGISEDELSRILQPYYTTKKEGHGLGMMIVQRIIRDHGGQLGIESRKGEGTAITLQFPQQHRRTRLLDG